MLILKQEDYNKIVDHAKKGLPNEACGLLGGYVEGDKRVVTDVYLLRNVDESREHFSMDPAEQTCGDQRYPPEKRRTSRQFSLAPGIAVTPVAGRYPLSV